MTWRPEPADVARLGSGSLRARLARGEEREEVIDRLRRESRVEARAALTEAGLGTSARIERRRYGPGLRAVQRSSALLALSPDLDARQIHANTLLAARRYGESVALFRAIRHDAPDRRLRDAAALGISLGLSFLHEADEASRWCEVALRSPFEAISTSGALAMFVQSVRRGAPAATRRGLDVTFEAWTDSAPTLAARLLARYLHDAPLTRRAVARETLQHAGPRGAEVRFYLDEVLSR
jgi:hypothetical protein